MKRQTVDESDGRFLSRGLRYMVAGAFFFSVMSLLVKVAGQRLPSQQIVFARSVVMVVLAVVMLRRARVPFGGVRRRLLIVRGLLGFGALSSFYYALVHLPLADATVLQYTNPAFAAVIAVFALHEKLRTREVVSVLVSLAGVVLVAQPSALFGGAGLPGVPVLVGLLGAVLSGAAYVVVRMLGREHHLVIILYFSVISVVGSAPATLLHGIAPTPGEWLTLLAVGVTTHLGQIYLTRGLALERAGRATATALVQILFAAVWGALVFAQFPGPIGVLGAVLVIGGVLLQGRR